MCLECPTIAKPQTVVGKFASNSIENGEAESHKWKQIELKDFFDMVILRDNFKQWDSKLILVFLFVWLFTSCVSTEDKVAKNINYAWDLLNQAHNSEELDFEIPLGFKLNSTKREFELNKDSLMAVNGIIEKDRKLSYTDITTNYFGREQEIRISSFPYFSDPNTQTDSISYITFIFDELRNSSDSKVRELLTSISRLFDETWQVAEFQLDPESEKLSHYFRYWIKNNIVAVFSVDYPVVSLEYHNAPKSYSFKEQNFFKEIEQYYTIKEKVKEDIKQKKNKPKIMNSPWDGSVYQVKNYLNKTLKDPKSYEGIEWSEVVEKNGYFIVKHKYRAKNSFGGYVVETAIFQLDDSGTVVGVEKIE